MVLKRMMVMGEGVLDVDRRLHGERSSRMKSGRL